MQNHYKIITLAVLAILAGGCSKPGSSQTEDTVFAESASVQDTALSVRPTLIDSLGIHPVRVGMSVSELPEKVEGTYDRFTLEEGYGSTTYLFFNGTDPLFAAYSFDDGRLDIVSAESAAVAVLTPEGGKLHLGDLFSEVLELPGVKAEWESSDGEGMWCWIWDGLWFQPDQSRLPDRLSRSLYNQVSTPVKDDFTDDAVIGYIGTGLPW